MAEKVTFINSRGQSVELTNRRPFLLQSVDGKGDVEADVQMQKAPFQHGNSYIGSQLQSRPLALAVSILTDSKVGLLEKQQYLASVFNPILGEGRLIYENGNTKREIQAVSENIPVFPTGSDNKGHRFQRTLINLICPSPFWVEGDNVEQLVNWEGGLQFPLELPTFFAEQSENKDKIILNKGDVETPLFIIFHGPASAPIKVINHTTNEFIEVNQNLLEGEKLEINTSFGRKKVTKVLSDGTQQNAFHFISLDSTFIQLAHGNNLIGYMTGGYDSAGVSISWKNRYLSV